MADVWMNKKLPGKVSMTTAELKKKLSVLLLIISPQTLLYV